MRWPSLDSVATSVLVVATFVSSFATIADYAVRAGVATLATSWAWPVAVDGLVIVATLRTRALARAGQRTWPAWLAGVGALIASVTVNVAHAVDQVPDSLAAGLMAALVPASLAVGLHLPRPRGSHRVATPGHEVATPGHEVATAVHEVAMATLERPPLATAVHEVATPVATATPDRPSLATPGQAGGHPVAIDVAGGHPGGQVVAGPWPPAAADGLTPERAQQLVEEHGNVSAAARAAGVSRATMRRRLPVDSVEVST